MLKKIYYLLVVIGMSLVFFLQGEANNTTYAYNDLTEDQKLYYGYNVTGGKSLMEMGSQQMTFPIIDSTKTYNGKTYNDYISKVTGNTEVEYNHITAYSMNSMNSQYALSIGADVYGKIYCIDTDISASFDTSSTLANKYSEYYEMVSAYIARYYYILQDLDVEEIRYFITDKFKSELSAVSSVDDAKKVISRYGTHLNTGYILGGRLNITNYQVSSSTSQDFSQVVSLQEKVSTSIGKIKAGESVSFASTYANSESTETTKSNYNYKSYGGKATSSFTLDGLFTYSASILDSEKSGFMYTAWVNSINNDENLAIIDIPNGAQSIPVWNLLENNSSNKLQRNYLQQAYRELCGDKYEEYQSKYKELERNITSSDSSDETKSTLNGLYVRTSNNYFYYVDEDFTSNSNFFVSKGQYLYLDVTNTTNIENINYSLNGCELIDKKNSIFKVTNSSGKVQIRATYGSSAKSTLFEASIKSNSFEMGYGTDKYPYVIKTKYQLKKISDQSASYILYDNIDMEGDSFKSLESFTGTFNGNYFEIKNCKIESNGIDNYGLFGSNSGTIKNLKLTNIGTSIDETSFKDGGVNFRSDFTNDTYTNNSISVKNAGILCGQNSGTIDNCYIENAYIRNVVNTDTSNSGDYTSNSICNINLGTVAGINSGTIKNSMVYNSHLLNSFHNTRTDSYEETIRVCVGGLVGYMDGGTVEKCVMDSGDSGLIYGFNAARSNTGKTYVYASGLIGFINKCSSIKNNYAYVREAEDEITKRVIDISVYLTRSSFYKALMSGSMILASDLSTGVSNNYALCKQSSNGNCFGFKAIYTNDTSGNNINGGASTYNETTFVSEKDVTSNNINEIFGSTIYFEFNDGKLSKIKHLLENDRNGYIQGSYETDESASEGIFYQDEIFTLTTFKNLSLKQTIKETSDENVVYYIIDILSHDDTNVIDQKLSSLDGEYKCKFKLTESNEYFKTTPLTIRENTILRIYVDEKPNDDIYIIYKDQVEEYITNFNFDNINLKGVKSNGEIIEINQNGIGSKKNSLSLQKPSSSQYYSDYYKLGENLATVKYGTFSCNFTLYVNERNITSITIDTAPSVTTYKTGSNVSLNGMSLTINYDEGESRTISSKSDLANLEVIGGLVAFGENEVAISYEDYSKSNMPTFKVYGKATVKFVDYDGTIISEEQYNENETVREPETPVKPSDNTYIYEFKGWDKQVTTVSGDVTYTATYTATYIDYTIKFVNYDETELSSKTYHYGDTVIEPETPVKPSDNTYSYEFKGWDKQVTTVSGDVTYTAIYTATYIDYTIKFVNYDGTELSLKTYHYGDTVVEPETPVRLSDDTYAYEFKGWDKEITTVSGDVTYTAIYTATYIDYTIKFVNYDGTELSLKTYHYGDTVVEPETPVRLSDDTYAYEFKGWDKEVTTVSGDVTYTATYTAKYIEYTVKFVNYDETILSSKTYHYGDTVVEPETPVKPSDELDYYVFNCWDKEISIVISDTTYTATYKTGYEIIVSEIDEIQNVDLSTYNKIIKIKNEISQLSKQRQNMINDKFNKLVSEYEKYVSNINKEYEAAEQINEDYFVLVLDLINEVNLLALCAFVIKFKKF